MEQKKLFFVVGIVAIVFIVIGVIIFGGFRDEKKQGVAEIVEDDSVQKEKNIAGIAEYTFSEDDLESETRIEMREVDGNQKECMVIVLEDATAWEQLSDERRDEIMKGFINTSRLQIDREFGCVVVEHQSVVMMEGFWRNDGGYVIMQK